MPGQVIFSGTVKLDPMTEFATLVVIKAIRKVSIKFRFKPQRWHLGILHDKYEHLKISLPSSSQAHVLYLKELRAVPYLILEFA